jgi:hypothetical protein
MNAVRRRTRPDSAERWWLTFWKRAGRYHECGNPTAPGEVIAYYHPTGRALCQLCAERKGVLESVRPSKRLKTRKEPPLD